MASRQQEKLAERKAKKALRDSQKRSEAPKSETDAADHNSKRIKVTIPRPPPQHKQLDNQSKGSSSASLIGDKVFRGAPCVLLTRSAFGVVSDSNNAFGAVPDLNPVRGCTRLANLVRGYTRLAWLFRGCARLESHSGLYPSCKSRSGLYPIRMALSGLCPT
ncbi:methylthioribose-1-phosphate isomerase [Sesbania bispinosa]|nr:methylthioribose-1-phosphate isomerase [Sesbania bispinosa]